MKAVILGALKLDHWELNDSTIAGEIPGWDSLSHVNVVLAVEQHFGVRFRVMDVLRLKNVGDLQRLLDSALDRKA
jgi:acyl carrier protein